MADDLGVNHDEFLPQAGERPVRDHLRQLECLSWVNLRPHRLQLGYPFSPQNGVVTLSNCSRVNFWGQPLLKRQRLRSAIRSLLGCETGVMFFGISNGVGR